MDGSLDTTFNPGGMTISIQDAVLVQPDGKMIFASTNWRPDGGYVKRFNADGTLDTSFTVGVTDGQMSSLALQSDGKILIA